jgi:hypothetical protein
MAIRIPQVAKTYQELDILIASMGKQQLLGVEAPLALYAVFPESLVWRACMFPELRYARQISPSFLQAPHGCITACFMNVVGAAALSAWNTDVTQVPVRGGLSQASSASAPYHDFTLSVTGCVDLCSHGCSADKLHCNADVSWSAHLFKKGSARDCCTEHKQ